MKKFFTLKNIIIAIVILIVFSLLVVAGSYLATRFELQQIINQRITQTGQAAIPDYFQKSTQRIVSLILDNQNNPDYDYANKVSVPILEYHYIRIFNGDPKSIDYQLSLSPEQFKEQLDYLYKNNYTTLDVSSLMYLQSNSYKIPKKSVILTFDDGHRSIYSQVFPLLKKYNFVAESFVISSFVNSGSAYVTWDMLKEMSSTGYVTIGSHTVDHKHLSQLSDDKINFELTQSKHDIEAELGITIIDFCYPYADYDSRVLKLLPEAGYKYATSGIEGLWDANQDPFLLKRVYITSPISMNDYILLLTKGSLSTTSYPSGGNSLNE